MIQKTGFLLIYIFSISLTLSGQAYETNYKNQPLNKLLIDLRARYDLHFSFDDQLLSAYSVTISEKFSSPKDLINDILKGYPLDWEMVAGVFVIFPTEETTTQQQYIIKGQTLEKGSGEPLPFSHVLVNSHPFVTDLNGFFSYTSTEDSVFETKVSHLGCFILDTTLTPGWFHKIYLTPSPYKLAEIKIKDNRLERAVQMGETPGLIKLNSYIAGYLPGNGDNAVFNLLRLQPGIVAAGEQPNDLILWGSYEGTSRVTFDGFTIWGLKNFNDNISVINPFLTKDVEIFKGGYEASKEDVVGGLVSITGNTGNRSDTEVHFFINNQTVNGMAEIPLSSKSSLLLASRHTYYNLFDAEDVPLSALNESENLRYKIDVKPDYRFSDVNAKYSWHGDDGSLFYISLLGASDDFAYTARQERLRNIIYQKKSESNKQGGASLFWGKNTATGNRSNLKIAWSALRSDYNINRYINNIRFNFTYNGIDEEATTMVGELSANYQYIFSGNKTHQPSLGLSGIYNHLNISDDSSDVKYFSSSITGSRLTGFIQDKIFIQQGLELTPGFRVNHYLLTNSTYIDPRLKLEWKIKPGLKMNAAWGSYHQFLIKSSILDASGNYNYTWALANGDDVRVLSSQHWVAGASYSKNSLLLNINGYYKSMTDFPRYVRFSNKEEAVYLGQGFSYGLDLFIKKNFNGHTFWTSYSLSRAEELFPYFPQQKYRRAPHDQRHEIKLATLIHLFNNFHFSTTYIFGTGFPLYSNYISDKYTESDYSRLDMGLVYRLPFRNVRGEVGLSLLNTLDHNNIKYSSFERIPLDQLNTAYIDAEAVGFTPLLFFKIEF
ncbi:TonB-dependent receptor [Geofilum sp. OHC36d9]|uniref:TonB-dependent receptor n=1 Tax=Geofilum sp. OHC36d9 TaxID=3458413 RepID=UPI00403386CB